MGKLHYFTALLLVILLAVASGWIFESIEKNPVLTKKKARHDPDYYLKNFTSTTMNKDGKPDYIVKAEQLDHYPDDDSMQLAKPVLTFYEKNKMSWMVQANEATVLQQQNIIHLNGDVRLEQKQPGPGEKALVITAKQLTLEPKKNIAHTKSDIKLQQGKNYIHARGMHADIKNNRIKFLSRTRSHYVLP